MTEENWISLEKRLRAATCSEAVFMPSYTHARILFSQPFQHTHFLPLFLIPWLPVFKGPLPPAFLASSSRAFLSVANRQRLIAVSHVFSLSRASQHTSRGLELVGLVLVILLDDLLLGLLVVDGVGTRW
jgi:hypothetical protein